MTVFGEPQVDLAWDRLPETDGFLFAVEYRPASTSAGDSAAQCIQLQTQRSAPSSAARGSISLKGG